MLIVSSSNNATDTKLRHSDSLLIRSTRQISSSKQTLSNRQTCEIFFTVITVSDFNFMKRRHTPCRATSLPSVMNTFVFTFCGGVAPCPIPPDKNSSTDW